MEYGALLRSAEVRHLEVNGLVSEETSGLGALRILSRGFSPSSTIETSSNYTAEQTNLLAALTIAAATISVIAGSLSLYWFIRMRRAFRHHLIMLLIFSNLWRALWYFLFPVVRLAQGSIGSESAYCQLSGFMLSYGIEGADFAVLVIAIHAALCIFYTSAGVGENGLYRFRHTVYALWVALPALAGGLAFLDKDPVGYQTNGAYCYLPVRPFWYRLALSWIPRYIILICIAVTYLAIYLYVKNKFESDGRYSGKSWESPRGTGESGPKDSRLQKTVESDTLGSWTPSWVGKSTPHLSDWSPSQPQSHANSRQGSGTPMWENYAFGTATPLEKLPEDETIQLDPTQLRSPKRIDSAGRRGSHDSQESVSHIIEALRENQNTERTASALGARDQSVLALDDAEKQPIEGSALRTRHRHIKRQMRFLFVYPIVYLISWIVPFVAHCLSYSDQYAKHPNFGLTVASTVILALQCAADTILFSTREKPWRCTDSDEGGGQTILGSLMPWKSRRRSLGDNAQPDRIVSFKPSFQWPGNGSGSGGGSYDSRSHGRFAAESRIARKRKQAETASAREAAPLRQQLRKMSLVRRDGRDRSWWEQEGRQRKDSVLLGTDSHTDAALEKSTSNGTSQLAACRTNVDPIREEAEEGDGLGLPRSELASQSESNKETRDDAQQAIEKLSES